MIKSMSFYSYELNKEKYDKIKDYAILCLKQKNILSFYINKDLKIARKLNEEMNEIASDQSIAYADDVLEILKDLQNGLTIERIKKQYF